MRFQDRQKKLEQIQALEPPHLEDLGTYLATWGFPARRCILETGEGWKSLPELEDGRHYPLKDLALRHLLRQPLEVQGWFGRALGTRHDGRAWVQGLNLDLDVEKDRPPEDALRRLWARERVVRTALGPPEASATITTPGGGLRVLARFQSVAYDEFRGLVETWLAALEPVDGEVLALRKGWIELYPDQARGSRLPLGPGSDLVRGLGDPMPVHPGCPADQVRHLVELPQLNLRALAEAAGADAGDVLRRVRTPIEVGEDAAITGDQQLSLGVKTKRTRWKDGEGDGQRRYWHAVEPPLPTGPRQRNDWILAVIRWRDPDRDRPLADVVDEVTEHLERHRAHLEAVSKDCRRNWASQIRQVPKKVLNWKQAELDRDLRALPQSLPLTEAERTELRRRLDEGFEVLNDLGDLGLGGEDVWRWGEFGEERVLAFARAVLELLKPRGTILGAEIVRLNANTLADLVPGGRRRGPHGRSLYLELRTLLEASGILTPYVVCSEDEDGGHRWHRTWKRKKSSTAYWLDFRWGRTPGAPTPGDDDAGDGERADAPAPRPAAPAYVSPPRPQAASEPPAGDHEAVTRPLPAAPPAVPPERYAKERSFFEEVEGGLLQAKSSPPALLLPGPRPDRTTTGGSSGVSPPSGAPPLPVALRARLEAELFGPRTRFANRPRTPAGAAREPRPLARALARRATRRLHPVPEPRGIPEEAPRARDRRPTELLEAQLKALLGLRPLSARRPIVWTAADAERKHAPGPSRKPSAKRSSDGGRPISRGASSSSSSGSRTSDRAPGRWPGLNRRRSRTSSPPDRVRELARGQPELLTGAQNAHGALRAVERALAAGLESRRPATPSSLETPRTPHRRSA